MLNMDGDDIEHTVELTLINGENTFYVLCEDIAENTLVSSQNITIMRDSTAPVLENLSYVPLFVEDEVYYTNDSTITISGDSEPMAKITIVLNGEVDSEFFLDDTSTIAVNIHDLQFEPSETITLINGSTMMLSSSQDGFEVISSDGHSYDFNLIDSVTIPLEISNDNNFIVFQVRYGGVLWGRLQIDLETQDNHFSVETSELEFYNTLQVFATDDMGNVNESEVIAFLRDTQGPTFTNPQPTATDNKTTSLSVFVTDSISGLNASSIELWIDADGSSAHCNRSGCTPTSVSMTLQDDILTINSALNWISGISGVIHTAAYAEDNLGNPTEFEWETIVDIRIPDQPNITVQGELLDDGVYYTGTLDNPFIEVEFDELIDITAATLDGTDIIASISTEDNMTFSFDSGLTTYADDGQHTFNVSAVKQGLNNGSSWHKIFIRDSQWPDVEIDNELTPTLVGADEVTVQGNYSDDYIKQVIVSSVAGSVNATLNDGEFTAVVPLVEGLNNVIAVASDIVGHSKEDSITINYDTIGPEYCVLAELPTPTALMTHLLEGRADPTSAKVIIELGNESSLEPFYNYTINGSDLQPESTLKWQSTLSNDVSEGDMVFKISGTSLCGENRFGEGNYLQFNDEWYRYKINDCSVNFPYLSTTLTLESPLDSDYAEDVDVSSFAEEWPSGYFNHTINLSEGLNIILASAFDEVNLRTYDIIEVTYDPSMSLDIDVIYPEYQHPTIPDGYSVGGEEYMNNNGIPITISTDQPADCTISHVGDFTAHDFIRTMTSTNDIIHTFNISEPRCGATHCLIMGNASSYIYHEYDIYCEAADLGLNQSLTLVFETDNVINWSTNGDYVCNATERLECSSGDLAGTVTSTQGSALEGALIEIAGRNVYTIEDESVFLVCPSSKVTVAPCSGVPPYW